MRRRDLLIAGDWVIGPETGVSKSPYDGRDLGTWSRASWDEASRALDGARDAFASWRTAPRRDRAGLLRRIAGLVRDRAEDLAGLAVDEIGKPIMAARGEVARMALTFDLAADLLSEPTGELLPTDFDPRGDGYVCRVERFPIGVVLGFVPYNWPYNLAAHKVAPALAAGNAIVLKPSSQAVLCTGELAALIVEAGCPPGVVGFVPCANEVSQRMVEDERVDMLSFTGSPAVGWSLKALAPGKRVALELGGNAFAIVEPDADLDWAAARLTAAAFVYAGQVCISVQHVLCARSIYKPFVERMAAATAGCPWGDPAEENVVCGPLISEESAERIRAWLDEAVVLGARVRVGDGVRPTLVEGAPVASKLRDEEVFGPVVTVEPYDDLDAAIARVNSSQFGIHASVFSRDVRVVERCYRELAVGGVIAGDAPNLRFDNMPYGGVKRSGFGREGLRSAFDEMTEPKAFVIRTI